MEYSVLTTSDDYCRSYIIINGVDDVYYLQEQIYDEISKEKGEQFTILVDLILKNGFSFNRFITLNYKSKNNCRVLVNNPREISENVKSTSVKYLNKNQELLENSSLSARVIKFIKGCNK